MKKKASQSQSSKPVPPKPSTKGVRVLSSKITYRAPVFYVTSEQVVEPSGNRVRRDLIRHPGSVVIMGVDDTSSDPRVLLARQYRYAADRYLWEFPAGRIDEGESALAGAKRELLEETGYTAQQWQRALFFYVSPGFLDETMALYLALGLKPGKAKPEEDEEISKRFFPLAQAVGMVMSGKIMDAKTIAGILWLQQRQTAGA
jgi:ADP-ribose pyrophosphatase